MSINQNGNFVPSGRRYSDGHGQGVVSSSVSKEGARGPALFPEPLRASSIPSPEANLLAAAHSNPILAVILVTTAIR